MLCHSFGVSSFHVTLVISTDTFQFILKNLPFHIALLGVRIESTVCINTSVAYAATTDRPLLLRHECRRQRRYT